jgi:hypothetical protein
MKAALRCSSFAAMKHAFNGWLRGHAMRAGSLLWARKRQPIPSPLSKSTRQLATKRGQTVRCAPQFA